MKLASTLVKQKVIKIDAGKIKLLRRYSKDELLKCGIINLDKPRGPRCRVVLNDIKKILSVRKLGHAGTLDPNTTGVLPVLIGKATKLSELLSLSDKIYKGKFKLHGEVSKEKLLRGMSKFIGKIQQLPPKLSAVKRVVRTREVYWFRLLKLKKRVASFEMACQHGTYVRKACHDLGEALGVGAHMFELRRTQSGPFKLGKSVRIGSVSKRKILGPEAAIKYIPKVWIDSDAVVSVIKGTPVFVPGVLRVTNDFAKDKLVAILGQDNRLKALGIAKLDISKLKQRRGIAVKTDLVLV
tara:strand:+ start:2113 stop:3003 length:891 start_codon:yes stop_codon:yes gene_type:complete